MLGEGTQTVNSENAFTKTTPISFIFYLLPHSGPTWEFQLCLKSCKNCKLDHGVDIKCTRNHHIACATLPPHSLRNPPHSLRNPNRHHSFFYFYITQEVEIWYATLILKNDITRVVLDTLVGLVSLVLVWFVFFHPYTYLCHIQSDLNTVKSKV